MGKRWHPINTETEQILVPDGGLGTTPVIVIEHNQRVTAASIKAAEACPPTYCSIQLSKENATGETEVFTIAEGYTGLVANRTAYSLTGFNRIHRQARGGKARVDFIIHNHTGSSKKFRYAISLEEWR